MSVLSFDSIQDQVVAQISGDINFAGESIFKHEGKSLQSVEDALNSTGRCVVVFPPARIGNSNNGLGASIAACQIGALFLFNPEITTQSLPAYLRHGVEAVLGYFAPNTPQDRFEFLDAELVVDEGLFGYVVNFRKVFSFRKTT